MESCDQYEHVGGSNCCSAYLSRFSVLRWEVRHIRDGIASPDDGCLGGRDV
jgi:hypothetical protein